MSSVQYPVSTVALEPRKQEVQYVVGRKQEPSGRPNPNKLIINNKPRVRNWLQDQSDNLRVATNPSFPFCACAPVLLLTTPHPNPKKPCPSCFQSDYIHHHPTNSPSPITNPVAYRRGCDIFIDQSSHRAQIATLEPTSTSYATT